MGIAPCVGGNPAPEEGVQESPISVWWHLSLPAGQGAAKIASRNLFPMKQRTRAAPPPGQQDADRTGFDQTT